MREGTKKDIRIQKIQAMDGVKKDQGEEQRKDVREGQRKLSRRWDREKRFQGRHRIGETEKKKSGDTTIEWETAQEKTPERGTLYFPDLEGIMTRRVVALLLILSMDVTQIE